MPPESDEDNVALRRKVLAEGMGFVLNAYLQSRSLLNPTAMAVSALSQYQDQLTKQEREQLSKQEAEMRAMVSQIENLKATFEEGKLVVHLDRLAVLGLMERMLRKALAVSESAMTAKFNINLGLDSDKDYEGELALASRSIYLKFVPEGRPAMQFAVLYLEWTRNTNPSELWLLVPGGSSIDIPSEPIFSENKISRGRLRTFDLTSLLNDLVGKEYDVAGFHERAGGYKFVISKKQPEPPKHNDKTSNATSGP
jgi:anti-sigma28 factor (negative regulator of flagellin synthesis)